MDAVVLESTDHLKTCPVTYVSQSGIAMAAEVALQNAAIFGAVEECAPGFEFPHTIGGFFGVQLGHAPVVEVLATAHGVREMDAPVVTVIDVAEGGGDSAFGHDGVGFAEKRFADDPNFCAGGSGFDRGTQTGAACPDYQNIVGEALEFGHLEDSPVVPDAHGTEAEVEVGEA